VPIRRPEYCTAEALGTKVSWISRGSERPGSVIILSDLGGMLTKPSDSAEDCSYLAAVCMEYRISRV
jgi:hypothetical protein